MEEGLGNNQGTGNYVTVLFGKFAQRVPADTIGAKSRVNKIGNTVWEKFYTDFTGKLVNIKVRDGGVYGKQWMFVFRANNQLFTLQLPYSNNLSTSILKMLPNVDLTKSITLQPSQKEEDGVMKTSIFLKQSGEYVKYAHTKTNPNGMPEKEIIMVNGAGVSDYTKQLIFLESVVAGILPKLEGTEGQETGSGSEGEGPSSALDGLDGPDTMKKEEDEF